MTFELTAGQASDNPIINPTAQRVAYEIRHASIGDGDAFVVLMDKDQESFVQCALDDEEINHFTLEYQDADQNHYRCNGWVETEDVVTIFLAFLEGRRPCIDSAWEDVTEEIFGIDLDDF